MQAMLLAEPGRPLLGEEVDLPVAGAGQVLIRVRSCGVCRTDLHVVDGELEAPRLPLIPGHQIVGEVVEAGPGTDSLAPGSRVGVPWLGWTCEECRFCRSDRENLCQNGRFTGYHIDGGFAEFAVADVRYCFSIPEEYSDLEAAPLLCAGLIGYRSLVMTGDAASIGLFGFGAAAHIITQVAIGQGRRVFAFTRDGDVEGQNFAIELGAEWAGSSVEAPPERLDAAIIFAPVGSLVPLALESVERGGTVVCAGIHMSEIPAFAYELLWGERVVRSVANLTRSDGDQFLRLAPRMGVRTAVQEYALSDANRALADLRAGRTRGSAVLSIG
jgi:propanol-preferring alcohol dehydrogenase